MSTETGLQVDKLTVRRQGTVVLGEVSLTAGPGRVTALLGANGAGKSTLAQALAGLLPQVKGDVLLNGYPLRGLRPERVRAAGLAVVPEGRRLLPGLSVRDNLRVATFTLDRRSATAGVDYSLTLFPELQKRWTTHAGLLSGGEQQMVVLAQAMVSKPRAILIDEMSLGLAPVVVRRLVPVLRTITESGTAVLLIEQFAHVALSVAQDAYVLAAGRIAYAGTSTDLAAHPEVLHSAYRLTDATAAS
jgi:branched-chain amino acid transport system ATP-binding protein